MSDAIYKSPLADRADMEASGGLSISIREIRDRGMIDLRGEAGSTKFKQAVKSIIGIDLPLKPRTSITKSGITVLWLSVDQWLILCKRSEASAIAARLTGVLGSLHSLVVDVSDARAIIRLEGDSVREVLMKGSSIDFTVPEYKAGLVRRLVFAEIAALAHIVSDKPCTIDVYVFRSYADYTWKWLLATSKPGSKVGLFSITSQA